jgi:hypothetical protein
MSYIEASLTGWVYQRKMRTFCAWKGGKYDPKILTESKVNFFEQNQYFAEFKTTFILITNLKDFACSKAC